MKKLNCYIVAKTKHLTEEQVNILEALLKEFEHPPMSCIVVESTCPIYEDTKKAIENMQRNSRKESHLIVVANNVKEYKEFRANYKSPDNTIYINANGSRIEHLKGLTISSVVYLTKPNPDLHNEILITMRDKK